MKKFLLFLAGIAVAASASAVDYYVIGENVNGSRWTLAAADAKFKPTETSGVYEWTGTILASGFKINDGTWSNASNNIGGNGTKIQLGTAYSYTTGGTSPNIILAEGAEVENPKLILNTNNQTITLTGEKAGEEAWYIMGTDNVWDSWTDDRKLVETAENSGIFQLKNFNINAAGTLKITTNGWGEAYGSATESFSDANLSQVLEQVYGETGDMPYSMTGTFDVEWNYNTKTLSFTRQGQQQEITYYLIGAGVNGNSWALKDESAKFTKTETGVYTVSVNSLMSAFKINDGTWENPNNNIGSNGSHIQLNQPYQYSTGATSGNITFEDFTELTNATVTLNTNTQTILIAGTPVVTEKEWYVVGINDPEMLFHSEYKMAKTDTEEVFELKNVAIAGEGSFKIATLNWGEQYGFGEDITTTISDDNLSTTLAVVSIDASVPYDLNGTYDITWNYTNKVVTFVKIDQGGIETVDFNENAPVEYFTIQGVRVNNPTEGIYICRRGAKVEKIIIK